jgi:hypothetical protein
LLAVAARIGPDGGGGGLYGMEADAWPLELVEVDTDAGSGIPTSVFLASMGDMRAAGRCELEPGGGGGAAAGLSDFFPRPSKMSRSDPPPRLLSFDIRVS